MILAAADLQVAALSSGSLPCRAGSRKADDCCPSAVPRLKPSSGWVSCVGMGMCSVVRSGAESLGMCPAETLLLFLVSWICHQSYQTFVIREFSVKPMARVTEGSDVPALADFNPSTHQSSV